MLSCRTSGIHPAQRSSMARLWRPPILRFVLARPHPSNSVKLRPAVLPQHRRYRVKEGDYPAILPASENANSTSETAVRGTGPCEVRGIYVTGLVASDLAQLDQFEGNEYERRMVKVRLLAPSEGPSEQPLYNQDEKKGISRDDFYTKSTQPRAATGGHTASANGVNGEALPGGTDAHENEEVETQTYIWRARLSQLEMNGEWILTSSSERRPGHGRMKPIWKLISMRPAPQMQPTRIAPEEEEPDEGCKAITGPSISFTCPSTTVK